MHFGLSEDQQELADMIRGLLAKRSGSLAVRAAAESADGFDRALWQTLCEQVGAAALAVPEEYDGAGATLFESAVVLEQLGERLSPVPLLATSIAVAAVRLFGSEDQKRELLPRIAAGEIAAVVLDPAVVLDAQHATILLGLTGDAIEVLDGPVTPLVTVDQTTSLAHVEATAPERGAIHDIAAALTTSLQVGCAQRGLDMTVAYTKERVQFGRPIGSFQALKHRMADMLVLLETSRSVSWAASAAAASYVDQPTEANAGLLAERAAVAQSWCSDALDTIAAEAVQLHGGIAITWEHDAQLVFKRAHTLGKLNGGAHEQRARLVL